MGQVSSVGGNSMPKARKRSRLDDGAGASSKKPKPGINIMEKLKPKT